jgi:hypothetical protein
MRTKHKIVGTNVRLMEQKQIVMRTKYMVWRTKTMVGGTKTYCVGNQKLLLWEQNDDCGNNNI